MSWMLKMPGARRGIHKLAVGTGARVWCEISPSLGPKPSANNVYKFGNESIIGLWH